MIDLHSYAVVTGPKINKPVFHRIQIEAAGDFL